MTKEQARMIVAMAKVYVAEAAHPLADPHKTDQKTVIFAKALIKGAKV